MMRVTLVLITALAISGCAANGGARQGQSADSAPTPLPVRCDFELVSLKADPTRGVMGTFHFRHHEQQPIHLWGFGFEDAQGRLTEDGSIFRPRFETFRKLQEGHWVDVPVYSCGFGAEQFAIQPNRDYTFLVPLCPLAETGTRGMARLTGQDAAVESTPLDTAWIRRIAGGT